jgi:hypothetical protein
VERSGRVTLIGQDAFKVFFDTLFVFDPGKADVNKSTSEQFIPYLWARLEARWRESTKIRCEDGAMRSFRSRDGEVRDVASMVEDTSARHFTAFVDHRDEFDWARLALAQARDEGAIRPDDYVAILRCFELDGACAENGEREGVRSNQDEGAERYREV